MYYWKTEFLMGRTLISYSFINPSDFWPLVSTTNGCHAELLVHLHLHHELVETSRASSGRIVVKMDADGLWMSWSPSITSF